MTVADKLLQKLWQKIINAHELRTLLRQKGWKLLRTKGSHEVWGNENKTFVLATHSNDLKPYQIKEAQYLLIEIERREDEKKA